VQAPLLQLVVQQPLLHVVVQQGSHTGAQVVVQQGSHTGTQQVVGQQHALRHRRLCPASASQPDATTATQVSVPTKQRSRVFLPIIVEPLESLGGETGRTRRGPAIPRAGNSRATCVGEARGGAGRRGKRNSGMRPPFHGAFRRAGAASSPPTDHRPGPGDSLPDGRRLSRLCGWPPARRRSPGLRHRADAPGRRCRRLPRRGLRGSRGGPCRHHQTDCYPSSCPPPRS
jgi:hypothetical protein